MDGAPACPFVAFGDDRDGRSTSPDHRHRCFAESPPAPRAVAHQEAYCLSSAFPVCPTFQDWAKREAAHARGAGDRPESVPSATPIVDGDAGVMDQQVSAAPTPPAQPAEPVRRNPPRDWAAPPPWATGGSSRPAGSTGAGDVAAADLLASKLVEGQGLAGSAADKLAGGPDPLVAAAGWSASAAGAASTAPDDDLADLVQGRPAAASATPTADAYPPPARTGRRPAVSSTRPSGDPIPGPSWERMRRYEAYPTIRARASLPGLPRLAVLAGAIGIAALVLFMLPALLGVGGGGGGAGASPSSSRAPATAVPSPTVKPGPTPQVYIVKKGDTMSKIASRFGVTIEEIMAVNPEIKDPNKISLGQEIIIPAKSSDGASPAASAKASAKALERPAP